MGWSHYHILQELVNQRYPQAVVTPRGLMFSGGHCLDDRRNNPKGGEPKYDSRESKPREFVAPDIGEPSPADETRAWTSSQTCTTTAKLRVDASHRNCRDFVKTFTRYIFARNNE